MIPPRHWVLHLGQEKTGSTALQQQLVACRDALLATGVLLPRSLGRANQRKLPFLALREECRETRVMACLYPELAAQASLAEAQRVCEQVVAAELAADQQSQAVLVSSEHLSSRLVDRAAVARLAAVLQRLGARSVQLVIYLREQIGLALARHSMEVLSGRTEAFSPAPTPELDARRLLAPWEAVFGSGALRVRTYGAGHLIDGDVIADFASTAGFPVLATAATPVPARVNRSLDADGLALVRLINTAMPLFVNGGVNATRQQAIALIGQRFCDGPPLRPPPGMASAFLEAYQESNAWVDRHHGTHLVEALAAAAQRGSSH
ncbi:hypothetical protein EVJ50_08990 [Synechococcus sp. RSCCF101]|uniref:hypothetical protein n=1 Tax=Synechococcus sp. RSCCF101 TaxID=2511069 RepID=UPI001248ECDA|nr:hypothetical protein [Synechococcus sp. RSCCF101]QEY32336.1 hypothetical protein EVJ50_08990 [Synechococcus sp. RSCCF101]